jgi:hypothetical protein
MFVLRTGETLSRSRRVHIATFCRLFSTVFHHAAASTLAIRPVPVPVVEPTAFAPLVPKSAVTQAPATSLAATGRRAVAIAAVATPAQKEDLPAPNRRTNHEAKRLHVPGRGTGENLFDRTRS